MLFPTIEEYKDAIRIAEHSLATLKEYEVVKTAAGEPWFSSGGFAVVFKMKHRSTGKLLALKCFTRFQERRQESYKLISAHLGINNSHYLLHYNYLDNEIWAAGVEYPVVAMEWADGATLGDYVKEQCRLSNRPNLQTLAKNFEALTAWLITQPFAHGDLKPDNIIVRRDGSLALVDYDGMFVPAMQGQCSREFGSPVYRHPKRTIDTFDRYIDDFSLLVLLLELRLIAVDTKHYSAALSGDSIVAKSGDWEDVGSSRIYQALQTQGGVDWATWAAMLKKVPYTHTHHLQDWSQLVGIASELITQATLMKAPDIIITPLENIQSKQIDNQKTKEIKEIKNSHQTNFKYLFNDNKYWWEIIRSQNIASILADIFMSLFFVVVLFFTGILEILFECIGYSNFDSAGLGNTLFFLFPLIIIILKLISHIKIK